MIAAVVVLGKREEVEELAAAAVEAESEMREK